METLLRETVTGEKEKNRSKNKKKDYFDLDWDEVVGLKSFEKRIKKNKLGIAQTDKSSRFAVLKVE